MINYRIEGLDALLKKASPETLKRPMRDFFTRANAAVQGRAREYAPVDTGQLRNEILTEIDSQNVVPQWGKIGILNAREGSPMWLKARAMEYGTGHVGDPAVSHKSSHFPPGEALGVWAKRHGFASGFAVAAGIAKRGGLLPRKFLRRALADSMNDIRGFINQAAGEIRAAWDSEKSTSAFDRPRDSHGRFI